MIIFIPRIINLLNSSEVFFADVFPMLVGSIVFIAMLLSYYYGVFYTKKRHEEATLLLQNGQTYYFRNTEFDAESQHEASTGKYTYKYNVLHRADETNGMLYLYTHKNMATLIDKECFQKGTPEELRILLRTYLPASKCKNLWK